MYHGTCSERFKVCTLTSVVINYIIHILVLDPLQCGVRLEIDTILMFFLYFFMMFLSYAQFN